MKTGSPVTAICVAALTVVGLTSLAAPALATPGPDTSVIYNSVVTSPSPGNLPSIGAEAYAFAEFGNEVTFDGTSRSLTNVTVEMSSWGCVTGHWYSRDCSTPPGATFNEPITLNVYSPSTDGVHPGSLITSVTQTFAIPYRPSASPQCTGNQAGEWWDPTLKACFHGLVTLITFHLSGTTVPDEIVYGISYNTSHYGPQPYGESTACYTSSGGCGYDSLNIALAQDPANLTVGSDPNPGTVWQNSPYGSSYCDGGAAGTGTFRLDSPPPTPSCWSLNYPSTAAPYYVPAVQFKAGMRNG
jgi:hypothetical protein